MYDNENMQFYIHTYFIKVNYYEQIIFMIFSDNFV